MMLEFAGLPASGKTTLCRALLAASGSTAMISREEALISAIRYRDDGPVKNLIKKLPKKLWFTFLGPHSALNEFISNSTRHLALTDFCVDHLNRSAMELHLKTSIWQTFAKSMIEQELIMTLNWKGTHVIMDEAFAQRCFTLFAYMPEKYREEEVIAYADLAPVNKTLVWVQTPPKICIERLSRRFAAATSPYDLESSQLLEEFQTGIKILDRLFDYLESKGSTVLRIDGCSDLETAVQKVKATIQPLKENGNACQS